MPAGKETHRKNRPAQKICRIIFKVRILGRTQREKEVRAPGCGVGLSVGGLPLPSPQQFRFYALELSCQDLSDGPYGTLAHQWCRWPRKLQAIDYLEAWAQSLIFAWDVRLPHVSARVFRHALSRATMTVTFRQPFRGLSWWLAW